MNLWPQLIESHHKWAHPDDGWHLVTGPPATSAEIAQLEEQLGFQLPAEFKELYQTYNGVGISSDSENTKPSAASTDIKQLGTQFEVQFGFQLPDDLKELYQAKNGAGMSSENNKDVHWFFVPILSIPELITAARDWFQKTHADLANRFFPFIDWECGDYTGYLLPLSPDCPTKLHTFEHESYEFDEAQQPDEFLYSNNSSIREFFLLR
jgi:cell wall assembly regulator SMI1